MNDLAHTAAEPAWQASATAAGIRSVPEYCYQCVAGPDLLTVKVRDGVATEAEPNFAAAAKFGSTSVATP